MTRYKQAKRIKTETLIVGAGPAGMAAALELSKAGKDFVVVEKSDSVGGMAKTYSFKEGNLVFYTDNGPHRFFSKNKELYRMIEELLGEDWIKVNRQTRQFINGKFYDYPVNAFQAFRNLGLLKSARIFLDYVFAKIIYGLFRKPIINFEDYIVANFGRSLGEFNMINYTEKIWGIPAKEIHPDWGSQRIKGLNLMSLAANTFKKLFFKKSGDKPKSLVDVFYFPREGTGLIYETIKKNLEKKGYRFIFNSPLREIGAEGKTLKEAKFETPEGEMTVEFDNLVESVPVTDFVKMIKPHAPPEILGALKKMRFRSQVYLFVTLNKDKVTGDQWIYFPTKDTPIDRMSEMKNFSQVMSPPGKTSLFLEFCCFENDKTWNMNKDELAKHIIPFLEKAGFAKQREIRECYLIKQKNVYPLYDLDYKNYVGAVRGYLDGFDNLYYIGRPGRFRYNNQDHSLEMGFVAARSIIDGRRYDIEKVGDEKEYYEKGSVESR